MSVSCCSSTSCCAETVKNNLAAGKSASGNLTSTVTQPDGSTIKTVTGPNGATVSSAVTKAPPPPPPSLGSGSPNSAGLLNLSA